MLTRVHNEETIKRRRHRRGDRSNENKISESCCEMHLTFLLPGCWCVQDCPVNSCPWEEDSDALLTGVLLLSDWNSSHGFKGDRPGQTSSHDRLKRSLSFSSQRGRNIPAMSLTSGTKTKMMGNLDDSSNPPQWSDAFSLVMHKCFYMFIYSWEDYKLWIYWLSGQWDRHLLEILSLMFQYCYIFSVQCWIYN